MSACTRCGATLSPGGVCSRCAPYDASVMAPLAALRPEAEPPLPAAHESARPTGSRGVVARPTGPRESPSRRVIAAQIADPALPDAPGPIVDPSGWFEPSEVRADPPPPPAVPVIDLDDDLVTPTPAPGSLPAAIAREVEQELTSPPITARGHHRLRPGTPAVLPLPVDVARRPSWRRYVPVRWPRRVALAVLVCVMLGIAVGWLIAR